MDAINAFLYEQSRGREAKYFMLVYISILQIILFFQTHITNMRNVRNERYPN